jgi:conjugative transfer region protein TrbK
MSTVGRAVAYIVLAAALFAAAITFNVGKYPAGEASNSERPVITSDLDAELARCKKIGPETVDAACLVVWEANRSRFFRTEKSYRDKITDTVTDKPDSKDGAVSGHGALSDVSALFPGNDSPHWPVDNAGRIK